MMKLFLGLSAVCMVAGCTTAPPENQSVSGKLATPQTNSSTTITDVNRLLVNEKVPSFRAVTLDKHQIDSTYFRGKVTLINFMYIGCAPCMEEAPFLNKLYAEIRSPRFQMLCIAPQTPQQMKKLHPDYITGYGMKDQQIPSGFIPYAIIAECPEVDVLGHPIGPGCKAISRKFLVNGYPVVLLIDAQGVIRYRHVGFSSQYPPDLKTEIERLLHNG